MPGSRTAALLLLGTFGCAAGSDPSSSSAADAPGGGAPAAALPPGDGLLGMMSANILILTPPGVITFCATPSALGA